MAYIIPDKTGTVKFEHGATPTVVDLSDFISGVSITQTPQTTDVPTFTNPGATTVAKITTELSLVGLWSEALMAAIAPLVGIESVMKFNPTSASQTISADVRVETLPWGDFTVGEPVEIDIPLSVLTEPVLEP